MISKIKLFEQQLASMKSALVTDIRPQLFSSDSPGFWMTLSNGARIDACYWRLLGTKNAPHTTSFDKKGVSGESPDISVVGRLGGFLTSEKVKLASIEPKTKDVILEFESGLILQIFNFSFDEVWEINFADQDEAYSNLSIVNH